MHSVAPMREQDVVDVALLDVQARVTAALLDALECDVLLGGGLLDLVEEGVDHLVALRDDADTPALLE